MTPSPLDDRRLLAEALRWARSHGWSPRWPERRRAHLWTWVNASWPYGRRPPEGATRVTFDGRTLYVERFNTPGGWWAGASCRPDSVVQSVDVLVTFGILPSFLSSSYALAVDRHAELIECLEEELARRDHLLRMGDRTIAGLIAANDELRAAAALQLSPTGGAL